jgi:hypothetical protein
MNYDFELVSHGRMHPDYYQGSGSNGIQINVYYDNSKTIGEVIELVKDEVSIYWDFLESIFSNNGMDVPEDLEQEVEKFFNDVMNGINLSKICDPYYVPETEDDEVPDIYTFKVKFYN